jgi:tetratricopeptide (TPR) repeat protein
MDEAYRVLQDYLARYPDSSAGHTHLGNHFLRWGRLDEGLEALEKAESLAPGTPFFVLWNRCWVHVLREEWDQAEVAANRMASSRDRVWKLYGSFWLAFNRLYRGRSHQGLDLLEQAMRTYEQRDRNSGVTRNYAAHVLLEQGQAARALEHAQTAQGDDKGRFPEWEGLFYASLAQARLGRWDESQATANELGRIAEALPTKREKRRYHHLMGELALAGGDARSAVEELERAQSMLTPKGFPRWRFPQHVPIWFSLARAYFEAGDEDSSAEWFRRITESTNEQLQWPILYVRSFYFLGNIHENRGEMDEARKNYRRFYEYWKEGDLDRERVEEAKRKLGVSS